MPSLEMRHPEASQWLQVCVGRSSKPSSPRGPPPTALQRTERHSGRRKASPRGHGAGEHPAGSKRERDPRTPSVQLLRKCCGGPLSYDPGLESTDSEKEAWRSEHSALGQGLSPHP